MSARVLGTSLALLAFVSGLTGAPGRSSNRGAINFAELFQSLDANDDKIITRGEVPEPAAGRSTAWRNWPTPTTTARSTSRNTATS